MNEGVSKNNKSSIHIGNYEIFLFQDYMTIKSLV